MKVFYDAHPYEVEVNERCGLTMYEVTSDQVFGVVTVDHNIQQVLIEVEGEEIVAPRLTYYEMIDFEENDPALMAVALLLSEED